MNSLQKSGNGQSSSLLERLKGRASDSVAASVASIATDQIKKIETETGGRNLGGRVATTDVVISPGHIKQVEIVKPKIPSASYVLFSISRGRNLNSPMRNGHMIRFKNGYYLTDVKEEIEFIRENAAAWGVNEETLKAQTQPTDKK